MLVALDGVGNFRPVSASLPGLYRSAALDSATDAAAAYILDGARIRTIIDLRNNDEIFRAQRRASRVGRLLTAAYNNGAAVGAGELASEGCGVLRRYHVPVYESVDGFFDEVERRLHPAKRAEALLYKSFDTKKLNRLLYNEVSRGRQQLLYTAMLRANTAAWGRALALAADRREGGVLIHCAQGKDRTGVLAALMQHAAGDDRASIVESYAASEELLAAANANAESAREANEAAPNAEAAEVGRGVDWSAIRGSPPEAMDETFAWIRQEYGAIDTFLASVGCGEEWRRTLLR